MKRILALLAGCTFLIAAVADEMATSDKAKALSQQDQTAVIVEDTTGKGHRSRTVGDETALQAVMQMPVDE